MVLLKRIVKGLSVSAIAVAFVVLSGGSSSASTDVPQGSAGLSYLSVTSKTARTAAVPDIIYCTAETRIELVPAARPELGLPSFVSAKAATTCPVPMDNLTAQVELYEIRNGSLAIAGIGKFGNGPGFQQSSVTTADCPIGAVRTYVAFGYHTAAKAGYTPAQGRSSSGAYTYQC